MADKTSSSHIKANRSLTRSLSQTAASHSFRDNNHSTALLAGMYRSFQGQQYCDITLEAEGQEIRGHKIVLSAYSPYFEALFDFKTREEIATDHVSLPNISMVMLQSLLEFAYTGQVDINGDNVQDLLVAANFLNIQSVQKGCCDFMFTNMDSTNCLSIMNFAGIVGCADLHQQAKEHAVLHFNDLMEEDDFLDCPTHLLLEIIQVETLCVPDNTVLIPSPARQEEIICDALLKNIKHNLEERQSILPEVLKTVRLPLLTSAGLRHVEKCVAQMGMSEVCAEIFLDARDVHNPDGRIESGMPTWAKPREGTCRFSYTELQLVTI